MKKKKKTVNYSYVHERGIQGKREKGNHGYKKVK